ncbi:BUD13 homolog isoform X3 [Periophthalmus magnuspinnatus]|uniref:BUD13 homolog isoform X3 n=1 Tax=Periophthalmus magnuspinnatus TaxID=409849 RepID=UPI002436F6D0|nr:BUD13 homolog isoform X3 [Periophthalmus magnuspinnatus]
MAASVGTSKATELSKAEYLKRYLSGEDAKKSKGKVKKKRPKAQGRGLKIVDDDIDWRQIAKESKDKDEEDDEEAPVIAEVIDERPEEIKQLEVFRSSNRWKIIGADENEGDEDGNEHKIENSESTASGRTRHDSPDISPPRHVRHDSPDASPPKRSRHDSPDISPPRRTQRECGSSQKHSPKNQRSSPGRKRHDSDSDQSPPRKKTVRREASDSDQSPPRRRSRARQHSDSDQSPPRKRPQSRRSSDEDLSPPRRPGQSHSQRMLSGGKAGLVSVDVLRREQEENRRRDRNNQPLEDESRNAQTIFRDKSGKRRDLNSEREEQKKKAGEQAAKDEKYAQWGRGLAQGQMHQQRLEDALLESQKPLARHYDDEDLDKMLREQEREGDPMAAMLRRKKDRNLKAQGVKEKPRYKGPAPPPNRFNILPGYRWDGVDRSNGFEQKRYARMADKKAVQEEAYKWSVEDM